MLVSGVARDISMYRHHYSRGSGGMNRCLKVLTIGQQAHLDVTSTKVNQPNKHVSLNFKLINAFTMYVLTCCLFYISNFNNKAYY